MATKVTFQDRGAATPVKIFSHHKIGGFKSLETGKVITFAA